EHDDVARLAQLLDVAAMLGLRPLAAGDVHMDVRRRRALQATMSAIRHNSTLAECGAQLIRNGEGHLRTRRALGNIYGEELMDEAVQLARRWTFDLIKDHRYAYPVELVPEGHTPTTWLRELTRRGLHERWPEGAPVEVIAQIDD